MIFAVASGLLGIAQIVGITVTAVLVALGAWRGLQRLLRINAVTLAQDLLDAKDRTIESNQQSIEALETRVDVLETETKGLRDALELANRNLQESMESLAMAHEDYRRLEQFAAPQAFMRLEQAIDGFSGRLDEVLNSVATIAKRDFAVRNAQILETTSDGIVLVSGYSGTIEYANAAAERIFGYEKGELNDHSLDILIPDRFRTRHRQYRRLYMENPLIKDMADRQPLIGTKKDGTEIPLEITLSPMDGYRVVAVVRDATSHGRRKDDRELSKTE